MAFDLEAVKQAYIDGKAARDQYNRMLERAKNAVIAEINGAEFEDHLQGCLIRAFMLRPKAEFMLRCDISRKENESKDKYIYRITIELFRFEGNTRYRPCVVADVAEENILFQEKSFNKMYEDARSIVNALTECVRNRIHTLGLTSMPCSNIGSADPADTAYTACFGVWVNV